jgi:hypothetical protein
MNYTVPHHPCTPDWPIAMMLFALAGKPTPQPKCKYCSGIIVTKRASKYCSADCRNADGKEKDRINAKKARAEKKSGAPKPRPEVACQLCGKMFAPTNNTSKWCSIECRGTADSIRKRAYRASRA